MKNLDLPNPSQSLAFEHDTSSAADEPRSDMSYDLNLRHNSYKNKPDADDNESSLLQRRVAPETVLLQKLKDDLKRLPEDQGFDEFKDVPVEGFGAALLAGYGWSEGMGIGKNAKEDVKVVEYQRRTAKEGLGFVAEAPAPIRRNKEKEKDQREGTNESGKKEKEEKIVRIVGGRDVGLKGSVVTRIGDGYLMLKLSGSGEQVKVRIDDVDELGSVEEERCLKKLKELKIRSRERREQWLHERVKSRASILWKNIVKCSFVINGSWNWDLFAEFLSPNGVATLANIKPPDSAAGPDAPAWLFSMDGVFNLKSAYLYFMESRGSLSPPDQIFKKIWAWQGPPRIFSFLWKVYMGDFSLILKGRKGV